MEFSGSGDAARSLALLWAPPAVPRRGPRPKLAIARITAAAVALADEAGIDGVSMRRLAERLGVSAMALYKHVPGKAELVDLMVNHVLGEDDAGPSPEPGWRGRLAAIAAAHRALYRRHPWLLQVSIARPSLGPNAMARYERELQAIEGLGLSDLDMDAVLTLVLQFAIGAVRAEVEVAEAVRRTGLDDARWWGAHAPVLAALVTPDRFPLASRVGTAVGLAGGGPLDPDRLFSFGLQCLLDGIAHRCAPTPRGPLDDR